MSERPGLLILTPFVEPYHAELEREFAIHPVARAPDRAAAIRAVAPAIRAMITNSVAGASRELLDSLPRLEIITLFSAGYEGVDLAAAAARGIPVTTAQGANAASVAELALALMLAVQREIPLRDRAVRAGRFAEARSLTHMLRASGSASSASATSGGRSPSARRPSA